MEQVVREFTYNNVGAYIDATISYHSATGRCIEGLGIFPTNFMPFSILGHPHKMSGTNPENRLFCKGELIVGI